MKIQKTQRLEANRNIRFQLSSFMSIVVIAMLAVTEINLAERFLGLLSEPEKYAAQIAAVREKARIMRERKQRKPGTRGPKGKK